MDVRAEGCLAGGKQELTDRLERDLDGLEPDNQLIILPLLA
jgi:hypothetical protein